MLTNVEFFEFLKNLNEDALEKKVLECAREQTGDRDVYLEHGLNLNKTFWGTEEISIKSPNSDDSAIELSEVLSYILFKRPKGA